MRGAVLAKLGARDGAADVPADVLVRGVRAWQSTRRRKGRDWADSAAASISDVLEWRRHVDIEALATAEPSAASTAADAEALQGLARFEQLWRSDECGNDAWGRPVVWDRVGAAGLGERRPTLSSPDPEVLMRASHLPPSPLLPGRSAPRRSRRALRRLTSRSASGHPPTRHDRRGATRGAR